MVAKSTKSKMSNENLNQEQRTKALDSALAQIERQFGKGSIMKLGDENAVQNIEGISTGSLSLDIALGIGGVRVAVSSKSTDQKAQAKQRLLFKQLQRHKKLVGLAHLWMRNTP